MSEFITILPPSECYKRDFMRLHGHLLKKKTWKKMYLKRESQLLPYSTRVTQKAVLFFKHDINWNDFIIYVMFKIYLRTTIIEYYSFASLFLSLSIFLIALMVFFIICNINIILILSCTYFVRSENMY